MYFFTEVLIPANTVETAPVMQTLQLDIGVIDSIDVEFPAGCAGLVTMTIYHKSIQIVPWNKDSVLYGDDRIFHLPLKYEMVEQPFDLLLVGTNHDDTYYHVVSIGVMLSALPGEVRLASVSEVIQ